MTKALRRKKNNKGFTLVEMLMVVIILLLVGAVLTTGIRLAVTSYNKMLFSSNRQVLHDDINTAVNGLVRSSSTIKNSGGKVYFKSNNYAGTQYFGDIEIDTTSNSPTKDQLIIKPKKMGGEEMGQQCMLVDAGAYTGMKVTGWSISYDKTSGVCTYSYTIVSTTNSNWYKEYSNNKCRALNR